MRTGSGTGAGTIGSQAVVTPTAVWIAAGVSSQIVSGSAAPSLLMIGFCCVSAAGSSFPSVAKSSRRCASTAKRGLTDSIEALALTDAWHRSTVPSPKPVPLAGTDRRWPQRSGGTTPHHSECGYASSSNGRAIARPSHTQVPADAEPISRMPHQEPFRAYSLKKHDELQFEEHHGI